MKPSQTRRHGILFVVFVCGMAYTVVHLGVSGVWYPVRYFANIGQIRAKMVPVQAYLEHGKPVHIDNPAQYGPTFFFVLEPLLRVSGNDQQVLSRWLYGVELIAMLLGFLYCLFALRLWLQQTYGREALQGIMKPLGICLGFLWLNFSPLYSILAIKNVEGWELCLLSAGFYYYLRRWRVVASLCIAAAVLTKMIPAFYLFYFLLKDRRMLLYCGISLGLILFISHLRYGPGMGSQYLPFMFSSAVGESVGIRVYENQSVKGLIVKLFGGWQLLGSYGTKLSGTRMLAANVVGSLAQLGGLAWLGRMLMRRGGAPNTARASSLVPWEWALMGVAMLILSPLTGFDYTVLALPSFSIVTAMLLADPSLRRHRGIWASFGLAVFLVANVLPRQVINRLFPIGILLQATGNTHLNLSEGYQYFCFHLLGLSSLVGTLWMIRRRWSPPHAMAPAAAGVPSELVTAGSAVGASEGHAERP